MNEGCTKGRWKRGKRVKVVSKIYFTKKSGNILTRTHPLTLIRTGDAGGAEVRGLHAHGKV
jgi:hypothetical protein